jgi:hypothetical protein
MLGFAQFIGLHRSSISCLGLLLVATTGYADLIWSRNLQPEMISNEDVTQIQPAVHSQSFTMRNVDVARQLAAGIYGVENSDWRWTAGQFSIVLATPHGASTRGAELVFVFDIPDAIMRRTGPITLNAYLNHAAVGARTYTAAGAQRFSTMITPEFIRHSPVVIDFHLDRYVPAGVLEDRELGVVAYTVSLERE